MVSKFPECDLCPTSNCDDEKIDMVLQDADFTKSFVNNMLESNIDEISKDCYFMSEVISEKTAPMEIADFAFCIYVQLSQLVEMPTDKRMEIGVLFRQEFDRMAEDVSQGREFVKKKAGSAAPAKEAPAAENAISFQAKAIADPAAAKQRAVPARSPAVVPAKPTPEPVQAKDFANPRSMTGPARSATAKLPAAIPSRVNESIEDDARKFLADLEEDIAEIEEISSKVEKLIKSEGEPEQGPSGAEATTKTSTSEVIAAEVIADEVPAPVIAAHVVPAARKGGVLEPVIGKLTGVRPVVTGATKAPAAALEPAKPREPELGSKAKPIKLTPEMLAGIVSDMDMARVEKGIKIKRIDASRLAPKVAAPMKLRDEAVAAAARKPAALPEKIQRIERPSDKEKALSEELFSAFQQIKAREELPSTFNLETLGVGTHPEGEAPAEKETPGNQFITDLFTLSPKETPAQPKPAARPAIENLTLNFGEEKPPETIPRATPEIIEGTASSKTCPACGKPNPAKNVFCAKCGAKF